MKFDILGRSIVQFDIHPDDLVTAHHDLDPYFTHLQTLFFLNDLMLPETSEIDRTTALQAGRKLHLFLLFCLFSSLSLSLLDVCSHYFVIFFLPLSLS